DKRPLSKRIDMLVPACRAPPATIVSRMSIIPECDKKCRRGGAMHVNLLRSSIVAAMTGRKNPVFRAFAVWTAMLVAGIGVACRAGGDPNPHAQGPQAIPVKVQIARNVPVNDTTEYVATLKSRNSAVIMPQVEGHIREIYVHSGDRVEMGTALIEIDPLKQEATVTSQRSNRAAQEANLRWAEQEYQRISGLHSAGVVSKQELDRSKAALDAAQAQLQSLDAQVREQQVQLKYYKVEAPWSG